MKTKKDSSLEEVMSTPKCHRCGADLVQIKLTEDSEVGWYCVGCDADLIAEQEEAPTKIEADAARTNP
ncbi:MAG TPA: hypothetical protein V6C95_17995 [Coleofasciculaceae cyanobacterium]